eukprot:1146539-Pelagomonas_calceolata.AAC.2
MTVWAGRLTPHASVAVETSTCSVMGGRKAWEGFREMHAEQRNKTRCMSEKRRTVQPEEASFGWEVECATQEQEHRKGRLTSNSRPRRAARVLKLE